ncbi:hypothetical protein BRD03_10050 [Halobacteriales archaeon QS_9_68_17]|nr:MAG: hypothetical protein BRD03_10050 [Halobacteriales archaeon QS_9_68_17]
MRRYGDPEYERATKVGFALSVAMFAVGAGGELLASGLHWSLPAWEHTLLTGMEPLGVLGVLLVPFVFGIFFPLTE